MYVTSFCTHTQNYVRHTIVCVFVFLQVEDVGDPISTSAETLPDGVDETKEKTFKSPPNQRGEGQPSAFLRDYLRRASAGLKLTVQLMMLLLFMFFFSEVTLNCICQFTNSKANEMVYKKKMQRSGGKFVYQV